MTIVYLLAAIYLKALYEFIVFVLQNAGVCQASTYHALVVIFLEFFAWGLLTSPVISVSLFFSV